MEINGVKIGDRFKTGKYLTAKVVDFVEKKSLVSGQIIGYICIAQAEGMAANQFEVPFVTVIRNLKGE